MPNYIAYNKIKILLSACVLLAACLFFPFETHTYAEEVVPTIYVDVSYAGGDEDGSQEHPYSDLGEAVDEASSETRVCVASGTYEESDQTLHMQEKSGLVLEGGYESTGWTRNIGENETIIDSSGLDGNTIGIYNVSDVVIDGFTVTGAGTGPEWNYNGINIWHATSITIKNCKVIDSVGAGIGFGESTSGTVLDSHLENNTEGGINCYLGDPGISIENTTFVGNGGMSINSHSGIMLNSTPSVEIKNCTITGSGNNGIDLYKSVSCAISGCYIAGSIESRGINVSKASSATIFNNLIKGNSREGIGVWEAGTVASIKNNTIIENGGGGGINYNNVDDIASIEIKNNVFIDNNANNGSWGKHGICGDEDIAADITHNNSYGHTNQNYYNCGTDAGEDNNISADPLFIEGPNGYYYLSQIDSQQDMDSPCVDTGSDTAHKPAGQTPDELRALLEQNAVDMGASGKDNKYGWGRLDMPQLPEKGDINDDDSVDILDAIRCLRFAVDLDDPTLAQRYAADMDDNGEIDILDAIKILRKAVGLD